MKTTYRFMGLLGSLVYFGAGGNAYADAQSTPEELPPPPEAIMELELPDISTTFGSEFTMKFAPPIPGIDFKIVKVTPDPYISYKIRIIGPKLQNSFMGINRRRGEITRRSPWKK